MLSDASWRFSRGVLEALRRPRGGFRGGSWRLFGSFLEASKRHCVANHNMLRFRPVFWRVLGGHVGSILEAKRAGNRKKLDFCPFFEGFQDACGFGYDFERILEALGKAKMRKSVGGFAPIHFSAFAR